MVGPSRGHVEPSPSDSLYQQRIIDLEIEHFADFFVVFFHDLVELLSLNQCPWEAVEEHTWSRLQRGDYH